MRRAETERGETELPDAGKVKTGRICAGGKMSWTPFWHAAVQCVSKYWRENSRLVYEMCTTVWKKNRFQFHGRNLNL